VATRSAGTAPDTLPKCHEDAHSRTAATFGRSAPPPAQTVRRVRLHTDSSGTRSRSTSLVRAKTLPELVGTLKMRLLTWL